MTKHGRNGFPHKKFVFYDVQRAALCWVDPQSQVCERREVLLACADRARTQAGESEQKRPDSASSVCACGVCASSLSAGRDRSWLRTAQDDKSILLTNVTSVLRGKNTAVLQRTVSKASRSVSSPRAPLNARRGAA
jgi:hypothetical protein